MESDSLRILAIDGETDLSFVTHLCSARFALELCQHIGALGGHVNDCDG